MDWAEAVAGAIEMEAHVAISITTSVLRVPVMWRVSP
jgi:hypothetical protein